MADDAATRLPDDAASASPAAAARGAAGWRDVVLVAALVVGVVLGAAVLTSLLPEAIQRVVFHTPLAIAVLIGGTGWLLWRIARRPSA